MGSNLTNVGEFGNANVWMVSSMYRIDDSVERSCTLSSRYVQVVSAPGEYYRVCL